MPSEYPIDNSYVLFGTIVSVSTGTATVSWDTPPSGYSATTSGVPYARADTAWLNVADYARIIDFGEAFLSVEDRFLIVSSVNFYPDISSLPWTSNDAPFEDIIEGATQFNNFDYKRCCIFRAKVISVGDYIAKVEWTERIPEGLTFPEDSSPQTSGVPFVAAGAGCLLPEGVTKPYLWLCIDDNVLVLDSMNTKAEIADRFLIHGLDRKFHANPVPTAAWFYGGFVVDKAKYDYPWFYELDIGEETFCLPINQSPIPLGTDTDPEDEGIGTGHIVTTINSSGAVVAVKEFMLPDFETVKGWHGFFRMLATRNGMLYRFSPTYTNPSSGYFWLMASISLLCPRTLNPVETWTKTFSSTSGMIRPGFPDWSTITTLDDGIFSIESGNRRLTITPEFDANGFVTDWETEEVVKDNNMPATTTVQASRSLEETEHEEQEDYVQTENISQEMRTVINDTRTARLHPLHCEVINRYDHTSNSSEEIVRARRWFCQSGTSETCWYGWYEIDYWTEETQTDISMEWSRKYIIDGNEIGETAYNFTSSRSLIKNVYGTHITPSDEVEVSANYKGFGLLASAIYCEAFVALHWWTSQSWSGAPDQEKTLTVNFEIRVHYKGEYSVIEEWEYELSEPAGCDHLIGRGPENMGGIDEGALAEFLYSGEGNYSDTATHPNAAGSYASGYFKLIDGPPIAPMPVMYYDYYSHYFWLPTGEELSTHLSSKIGNPEYPSRFILQGQSEVSTGLPWIEHTNVQSPTTRTTIMTRVHGLDRKQFKITYWFDGVEKTRYFVGKTEYDIEPLRKS